MKRKYLLNLACLSLLFIGLAPVTRAQTQTAASPDAPNKKEGGECKREGKMKEKLGLTDDQLAKLKPVFQSEKEELSALKGNSALGKEEKRSQLKAIREKYKPQIAAILTPEQQAKMKEAREQRREAKKAGA